MRLKLTYGREELLSQFSAEGRVNVKQLLQSVKNSHPQFYQRWCDREGNLYKSLSVFINGNHIRYCNGLETELKEGDEVYIIPLITGG